MYEYNKYAYIRLILIVSMIGAFSIMHLYVNHFLFHMILSIISGTVLSGMINLAHECAHAKLVKKKIVNLWIGRFAASCLLINFTLFKWHHLEHHRYVGTDKDTEDNSKFDTITSYLLALSGLRLAKKKIYSSFSILFKRYPDYFDNEKKKKDAYVDAIYLLLFAIFVIMLTITSPSMMLYVYWLPLLFSYMSVMFFALPEHYGCEDISDFYSQARSVTSNAVIRYILWNANYHAEHHLYPGAPYEQLTKISKKIYERIYYHELSYFKWHRELMRSLLFNKRNQVRVDKCQN